MRSIKHYTPGGDQTQDSGRLRDAKKPAKSTKSTKSTKKFSLKSKNPPKSKPFSTRGNPQSVRRHAIYGIFTVIIGVGILSTAYYFMKWKIEVDVTDQQIGQAQEVSTITEVGDNESTDVIYNNENDDNPYWQYIKMNMIDVDFTQLKQTNSATAGWIQLDGTNINYPYVQTTDNDYYLQHSFDRTTNSAGWVFLDYRNKQTLTSNQNSILYAHGRVDGSMFGTLKNTLDSAWLDNTANHVVKISTPTEDTLWQVFSVYRTPVTSDYLQTEFESTGEYTRFLNMLQSRSIYSFPAHISQTDRILTLSTCIGTNDRVVLHAKLIKISRR